MQTTAARPLRRSWSTTAHPPSSLNTDASASGMGCKRGTARPGPPASEALRSLTCPSEAAAPAALPSAPGAANPRFPRAGLSSGPCNQPNRARTGPPRPARSSPWTPASGAGRGPRRPPPRQLGLGRRECAPPATPAPDLPAGESGAPGQRPRARERARRRPEPGPGTPGIPGGAGRGETPAGCRGPARPVAGVAGTWLSPQHQSAAAAAILPSTRCRRRRTPPQVSRMWAFPGVACAGAEDWGLLSAGPPAALRGRPLPCVWASVAPVAPVAPRRPRLARPR